MSETKRADVYPIGKKNPNLPFHPAVRAGDYIFVSGQVAKDANGNMLSGTIEDPATGSAATPLAALLLSLGKDAERQYDIAQGVEMGRPSRLLCRAWRAADGVRASVGGNCVPVLSGEVSL